MREPVALQRRFEVGELVGSGGMGMVYRARDRISGAEVALKLLPRGEDVTRFEREASVLARLRHPGIVGFVAHGETHEGQHYLAMQWLKGETLSARLKRKPLSLAETRALGVGVADALGAAHALGVVHRDLKPSNLFLVEQDPARVTLIDFGIAALSHASTRLTTTGVVMGTAAYMAPEQARGGAVDARSDLFSLGAVLFRCLAGRPPFDGEDLRVILAKLIFDEPPPLPAQVPPALAELVFSLLDKEPKRRPADAGAVQRALIAMARAPQSDEPTLVSGAAAESDAAISADEQQLVSVVIIDIPRASLPDGVASHRMPRPPQLASLPDLGLLRQRAMTFGASIEALSDGSLIAVLEGSENAADLAQRAARCALALRTELPHASALSLATGRGRVKGRVLVGEVVERALGLLGGGDDGAIRLDATSAGLLDASFVVSSSNERPVLVEQKRDLGTLRAVLGRETRFVGRARELGALAGVYDECVVESTPRVALVTGGAGLGKSRLRHETLSKLASHAVPPEVWMARADLARADSAFHLIRELCPASGELAELLSEDAAEESGPESAWRDPQARTQRIHQAFEDLLGSACARQPMVVVLEDLQWADEASLECIDHSLRTLERSRLGVFAFGRPEVRERFPGLWSRRGLLELGFGPLTLRAQHELLEDMLGESGGREASTRIIELASGNAFYLEELVRAVASGRGDQLPVTLLAISHARLAALPELLRRVLRATSVFGGAVWSEGVARLVGMETRETERLLERLCRDEVLQRDPASRYPKTTQYSFRQALLREAAYQALTEEDRLLGHRLAAKWLDEEAGERDPVVLAQHFARANQSEQACRAFVKAAWAAFRAGNPRAVHGLAVQALGAGAGGELLGEIHFLLGAAARWKGDFERALEHQERALEQIPAGRDLRRAAALRASAAAAALGRRERFLELAESLVAAPVSPDDPHGIAVVALLGGLCLQSGDLELANRCFEHLDSVDVVAVGARDAETAARILDARARRAGARGDLGDQLQNAERAVALYEDAAQPTRACNMRMVASNAAMQLGDWRLASAHLERAIVTARRHALENAEALCRANLGMVATRLGDTETGLAQLGTAVDLFARQGDRRGEGGARAYRAQVFLELDASRDARVEAERADELLRVSPPLRPLALAARARALLSMGKLAAASECAEEAWAIARAHKGAEQEGWAQAALALAMAQLASGEREAAFELLHYAVQELAERAERVLDAELRRRFVRDVPEHYALGELFEKLRPS